jgi:CRISPR system Cascade subunit CasE
VRKGEAGGFHVLTALMTSEGMQTIQGANGAILLDSVLYEGALEVTEPEAFQRTLAAGIGSGKGFGFGLLSLARSG